MGAVDIGDQDLAPEPHATSLQSAAVPPGAGGAGWQATAPNAINVARTMDERNRDMTTSTLGDRWRRGLDVSTTDAPAAGSVDIAVPIPRTPPGSPTLAARCRRDHRPMRRNESRTCSTSASSVTGMS